MILMGIDSSKHKTGIVIMENKKLLRAEYIEYKAHFKESEFLYHIYCNVIEAIHCYLPSEVIVEDLNIQFMSAARKMFPYHGIIKAATWYAYESMDSNSKGQEPIYVVNSQWRARLGIKTPTKDEKISRAFSIGVKKNGQQKMQEWDVKCATIEYINKYIGTNYKYEDNDLADAVGLCLWGFLEFGGAKLNVKVKKNIQAAPV